MLSKFCKVRYKSYKTMRELGSFIRQKREALLKEDRSYSQLQVSQRIGIEQSYLSKLERGVVTQLSEEKIVALAEDLGEDPDYLLALGGKVSDDVLTIIKQRPLLFSRLVRDMKHMPKDVIEADHDFKQRQSRMERLYDSASIGYFHLEDGPGNSVWSSLTPKILHLPPDAVPGLEAIENALAPESRAQFSALERNSRLELAPYHCELRLDTNEGSPRYVRVWGEYDALSDNHVVRLGLIQDITREVEAREELRQAHQALNGTVEEQNRQVAQGIEELKQEITARKRLEGELRAVNERIARQKDLQREYLRQNAYELRSQINALVTERRNRQDEALSCTISGISAIINNMNDFFNIDAGISPLVEDFDPRAVFEGIVSDVSRAHAAADVVLQITFSPRLPGRVIGDPQRMQQITHSISSFLLRVTPWGVIQLALDYLPDQRLLSLVISSQAATVDITEDCFHPGKGASAWQISTVGPIVKALRGSMVIDRTPSNGVIISLLFPSMPMDKPPREIPDTRLPVLVIEDDEYSRLYAERIIKKSGYEVETVDRGDTALARLAERRFSLVLLDIQLPDMDGVTLARTMRREGARNETTTIIAVTAHATPEDQRLYESAGINQFLAKPFKIETLRKLLERDLGG